MTGQLRNHSPWAQLGIFLGLLGGAFVFTAILMSVVLLALGLPATNMDFTDPRMLPVMKGLQAVSSLTIFLLPALFFALIVFKGRPFYALGIRPAVDLRHYGLAIAIIVFGFPLVILLGEINQQIPLPEWITSLESNAEEQLAAFLRADNFGEVLLNVFIIAVLPAVCEEICFRGALQGILTRIFKSPWAGILAASILFSALHFQFQGFLPRMYLGIVLGLMFWFSGSLWPAILAHFVHNATQVVIVAYSPEYVNENPDMPLWIGLASAVIVAAGSWFYIRWSTISYAEVTRSEQSGQDPFDGFDQPDNPPQQNQSIQ